MTRVAEPYLRPETLRRRFGRQKPETEERMIEGVPLPSTRVKSPPAEWRSWSMEQRIERLCGISLERIYNWLALERDELEGAAEINAQMQCIRVILMVTAKVGIAAHRLEAQREATLQRLVDGLGDKPIIDSE